MLTPIPPSGGLNHTSSSGQPGSTSPANGNAPNNPLVFAEIGKTPPIIVVPSIIKQSEYIAHFFAADLTEFVRLAHIDLATELGLPPGYFRDNEDIITMFYDDLAHMLRDGLITGIHLLLSDRELDPSIGAYPVRYHVQYTISLSEKAAVASPQTFGRLIAPPPDVIRQTRLTLLIDWNSSARPGNGDMRRPKYNFDWVPEAGSFDATTVMYYRSGSLSVDKAEIVQRSEKY